MKQTLGCVFNILRFSSGQIFLRITERFQRWEAQRFEIAEQGEISEVKALKYWPQILN